ncbi:TlpA disulfide reductase family protein [Limnohabitans sp. 2KL-27]|uniref:TlpA family protein disulfide reductase n=1 Tax=Limnohabitans sp. 2KL-27 TaxID=1100705 RepID=UPI000ADD6315|nr:TlpA disulfide reductase family protein [Limnohabitans sp. 2KL-27]
MPAQNFSPLAFATRRQLALGLGLGALWPWASAQAQSPSEAALEATAPTMPRVGDVLKVPAIRLLNGQDFQHERQPLLLYWWSSTCPFCALQSPSMQALWQSQKSRGLRMLALSIDKKSEAAQAYLQKRGYTFPSAWASPAWRQQFPKPKGLPITLLMDSQHKVLLAEKGQMFAEDVEAIARLL